MPRANTQPAAPTQPPQPRTPAAASQVDHVTCVCGSLADRSLVAQCTNCGYDLWALDTNGASTVPGTAPVSARRPVGVHLPDSPPAKLNTGFIDVMQRFSDHIRGRVNSALEFDGAAVDAQWKQVAGAILALHQWDPFALNLEVLRVNIMKLKIQEWAARDGMVDIDDIGWTPVLDFVEAIDTVEHPADRDWTTGPIELQYPDAVPVEFNHLDSIRRIGQMVADVDVSGQDVYIKLANVFNGHIEELARQNNSDLEILTTDITKAITSRAGWDAGWAFVWPTYFGQLGVYFYNDWVDRSHEIEWHIAKIIIDEHRR